MAVDEATNGDNVTRRSIIQLTGVAFALPAVQFQPSKSKVAADIAQGVYVPPSSDPTRASGSWVRRIDGPIDPHWFGITEGTGNGIANSAALAKMFAVLRARAVNPNAKYQGQEAVRFPAGYFEFNSTIDLTEGSATLEGADTGFPAGRGTILKFPAGVTGIRVQRYNTSGASTTDSRTHRGGDGAIIRNLALRGAYAGTEGEAHGIHLRARSHVENVYIEGFEGDGIYTKATARGGVNEGNANNSRIIGVRIQGCRRGIFFDGADVNICTIIAADCSSNRQWGIEDSSFLGNSYFGCHCSDNGITSQAAAIAPTVVSHNGNRYGVIVGQEAGASINAPSGTTASNTWWYYLGSGGVRSGIPAWSSGTIYRAGGSYRTDNANARNVFVGCYHEQGQGKAQLVTPTFVVGGILGGSPEGSGASIYAGPGGYVYSKRGFRVSQSDTASTVEIQLGEAGNKSTILLFNDSAAASRGYRLRFNGNDLQLDYQNSSALRPFLISGPATAQQFGTGAAVAHAFYPTKLMVGETVANARLMSNGTAAPSSGPHGAGEIVWNRTPASGQPMGWICAAAGTPGTWLPLANVP
jgi:hypothetical protein